MLNEKDNYIEKSKCCGAKMQTCVIQEDKGSCPQHPDGYCAKCMKPFTPQPSTPNYIESVLKEFDEKFGRYFFNYVSLPEYEKIPIEFRKRKLDMWNEYKSFLSTALEKQQKEFIEKSCKKCKEMIDLNNENIS